MDRQDKKTELLFNSISNINMERKTIKHKLGFPPNSNRVCLVSKPNQTIVVSENTYYDGFGTY